MRVLVTGAAGFVGSHVCRALLARGHDVVGLVRPHRARDRLEDLEGAVDVAEADLTDNVAAAAVVRNVAPDAAIHTAWYVEPGEYLRAVPENLVALEASIRLVRLLLDAGCERIVTTGTAFESEEPDGGVGMRPVQRSPYRSAKRALHEVLTGLAEQGYPATCAHIFYLYGPHEDERRLVPLVARSLLSRTAVAVTDGRQRRHYLHVADVADALCAVMEHGVGGTIDLCAGTPVLMKDLFEELSRATGHPELLDIGGRPYGDGEVVEAAGDPEPLRALGWEPRFDLEAGIVETVEWWAERWGITREP